MGDPSIFIKGGTILYNYSTYTKFPPFVKNIVVDLWGAGGGGGSARSNGSNLAAGGGGGGGAASRLTVTGSAFTALNVVPAQATPPGTIGNSSYLVTGSNTIAIAVGGSFGGPADATYGVYYGSGGSKGIGSKGERIRDGSDGGNGTISGPGYGGGGAGQDADANLRFGGNIEGGNGGASSGQNGSVYGGGGAGAATTGTTQIAGGSGARGAILFRYPSNYYEVVFYPSYTYDTTDLTYYDLPDNVYQVIVECWGAGGHGGNGNPSITKGAFASGGNGGNYVRSLWNVQPRQRIYFDVAGPTSDIGSYSGDNRTGLSTSAYLGFPDINTAFSASRATGGAGGKNAEANSTSPNTQSIAGCIGDVIYAGGIAGTGSNANNTGGGGGGAAGSLGKGGDANLVTPGNGTAENIFGYPDYPTSGRGGNGGAISDGFAGVEFGGGGGGASIRASINKRNGGNGAGGAGRLIFVVNEPSSSFLPFTEI